MASMLLQSCGRRACRLPRTLRRQAPLGEAPRPGGEARPRVAGGAEEGARAGAGEALWGLAVWAERSRPWAGPGARRGVVLSPSGAEGGPGVPGSLRCHWALLPCSQRSVAVGCCSHRCTHLTVHFLPYIMKTVLVRFHPSGSEGGGKQKGSLAIRVIRFLILR